MTAARPVMFRAGGNPGEIPHPAATAAATAAAGQYVLLADISEFQPEVTDSMYLLWSKAIIIRAAYGDQHDDRAWYGGQRRDLLHAGGAAFLGIYQYVRADQDPAAQAAALGRLLGTLRPGEKIIGDFEEGAGDQRVRRAGWAAVVTRLLGDAPWIYSGLNYAAAHGLAPVDWVAAYGQAEPSVAHRLWQFTDAYAVPGVGTCDCSVFHGGIIELAALAWQGTQPAPPAPDWTETLVNQLPTLGRGATGDDVKTIQGLLTARGYPVAPDGIYGPMTASQVVNFQHAAGFRGADVDGITGPKTWPKLLNR